MSVPQNTETRNDLIVGDARVEKGSRDPRLLEGAHLLRVGTLCPIDRRQKAVHQSINQGALGN
jgi:hypothetical protein